MHDHQGYSAEELSPGMSASFSKTATVTVKSVVPEKRRVVLETVCTVGETKVIEGEATVLAPYSTRPAGQAAETTQSVI